MAEISVPEVYQKDLISVIIPVLNEEDTLPDCIESILVQESPFEIIVVDGGSQDSTIDTTQPFDLKILKTDPGRWRQMNAGAEAASGTILIFVHADSRLPCNAFESVRNGIRKGLDGGAFSLSFYPNSLFFNFWVFWANQFTRVTRDFQGDRAIFCRREVFHELGGYREMKLMEDLDFSVRMRKSGRKTKQLHGVVTTSTRRFDGVSRIAILYWTLMLLIEYHLGRDPDKSASDFYRMIKR